MSSHEIPVIRINEVKAHPNADRLEVIEVFGYTVCVGKGQFKAGDLGVYIPPDYEVPVENPAFAFLSDKAKGKPYYRLRVAKIRGIISQGLLIPAPSETVISDGISANDVSLEVQEGDNLLEHYGIQRYVPQMDVRIGGDNVVPPEGDRPKYDVECGRRFNNILIPDEHVVITEKIHGTSARYVCIDGVMYCGSRQHWKKEDGKSAWWLALSAHPEVREFCEANPDITVYGEVYGPVQKLKYGLKNPAIAVFDLLRGNKWINFTEARDLGPKLPWVPIVEITRFNQQAVEALAESDSQVPTAPPGHMKEGVVVKPMNERFSPEIGRVQLKIVSNRYLGKNYD